MLRRTLCCAALALGCGAQPGWLAPRDAPEPQLQVPRPARVVLVTIDTLRADYVGAYGATGVRTPTLDSIARGGVRFDAAMAPTPITLPSHTTLMTGLAPPLHGVHHNGNFKLARGVSTLAQHFQERGYATAAFVAAVVLDRRYGLDYGFDLYDDRMQFRRTTQGRGGHGERRADHVVDAALAWLETAPDRFFLWLHLYDPHANYDPPDAYRPRQVPPPPKDATFLAGSMAVAPYFYAGEIAFADAELGRFLGTLGSRFGTEDTLLVATSDHGESLGEHGELTHTAGIYDATQRVPLLVSGPGIPAGRVVRQPVGLVDLAPTLVSLAGLRPLPRTDGVDLGPLLRGDGEAPRDHLYLETLATYLDFGWSPLYGVRTRQFKYVRSTRPELYDLSRDPGETKNLAEANPDIVGELDAALDGLLAGGRPLERNATPSAAERAQLEALGYVVDSPVKVLPALGWVGGEDPKDRVDALARMFEARHRLRLGETEKAAALLEATPEAGGFIAEARADAAREAGRLDEALRFAQEAVATQPGRAEAHLALARILEALGRGGEAAASYEQAAELDPSSSVALAALGLMAEERGDRQTAADYYQRAAAAPAPSAEAALRLAALRFEQGLPSRARLLLRDAWSAPGVSAEARVRAAWAEAQAGYSTLALRRLEEALRKEPGSEELTRAFTEIRSRFGTIHFPPPID